MFSSNRGFEVMIPKPLEEEKKDFNYEIALRLFSKVITLSFKVNTYKE